MDITPEQFNEWLAILGKPTMGLIVVFVAIYYRDTVSHIIKSFVDIVSSWLKRK